MIKYWDDVSEIEFILDNIRDEDREELENLYGCKWREKTLESLKKQKFQILYGLCGEKGRCPIAMGGIYDVKCQAGKIGCVWLLSSRFIGRNKTALMRVLRNQLYADMPDYDILYNFIYKSNYEAKSWLKKLGFRFGNPNPEKIILKEGFEFFYKRIERKK